MKKDLVPFKENEIDLFSGLRETAKEVVAVIPLQGLTKDNVEISFRDNGLEVKAKKKEEREEKARDHYFYESRSASFYKFVSLPQGLYTKKAKSEFREGVLEISIPKKVPPLLKGKGKQKK